MADIRGKIEANLARIRETIADACARSGRFPEEVGIVAVTKAVDEEAVLAAVSAGLTELGESRVQQLTDRAEKLAPALAQRSGGRRVRWHMIGHLQRNKVKPVVDLGAVVHSVDSLRLAEELNARAERMETVIDVLLEVNCSQEQQKFGVAVGAASYLGELLASLKHLRLVGLMTMAAQGETPEQARPAFARLREIFEEMCHEKIGGADFKQLSMGMSQDYRVAVEEGSTLCRIGTALFAD